MNPPVEYLGNVWALMEWFLKEHPGQVLPLSPAQMRQALQLTADVVAAKNELVRENNQLRERLGLPLVEVPT